MDNQILVIVPTIGRPQLLRQTIKTFLDTSSQAKMCVIADGEDLPDISRLDNSRIICGRTSERIGFWNVLNYGMTLSDEPIIGFFGNDVIFHEKWEEAVLRCFFKYFPHGKGLLAVKDDIWDDYHASHGFISRAFLEAIYGKPEFPGEYFHLYADGELTQFAKDLHRFEYCGEAYIQHLHPDIDARDIDNVDKLDKKIEGVKALFDARYVEWDSGGRERARKRL